MLMPCLNVNELQFTGHFKQWAAQLLNLIHQKGRHHKARKYFAQVLFAKAEIMAEPVPLVLQSVE